MADDAVFLTPGRPPMTKDSFASGFRSLSGPIETKQDVKEIHVNGDLAYCWSQISVRMNGKTHAGHVLTIFRKRGESWVLSRDANLLTSA